jgi:hypothetical protein
MKQSVRKVVLVAVLFTSSVAAALDGASKDAAYLVGSNEEPASLDGSSKDAAYFMSHLWELLLSFAGVRG